MSRVGQNRIYTPYMTVYLVTSLPKIPYVHRIYIWFWPTLVISGGCFHISLWAVGSLLIIKDWMFDICSSSDLAVEDAVI
jgi:hypothetical protein